MTKNKKITIIDMLFLLYCLYTMTKHPKERMIPKLFLKCKKFKKFEDKVMFGLHIFELTLIILIAAVTASMATFLPKTEENTQASQDTTTVSTPPITNTENTNTGPTDKTLKATIKPGR